MEWMDTELTTDLRVYNNHSDHNGKGGTRMGKTEIVQLGGCINKQVKLRVTWTRGGKIV